MVLDPMTGQEQEPQDLRIAIAHKVHFQAASVHSITCVTIYCLVSEISSKLLLNLQRFLYTSQKLSDKEKGKLQKEILDTVFAEGVFV